MRMFCVAACFGLVLKVLFPLAAQCEQEPAAPVEVEASATESSAEQPAEGIADQAAEGIDRSKLSPGQREALLLAEEFAAFDRTVWTMVDEGWEDGEACLERVRQHMEGKREALKELLAAATTMTCESKGAKRAVVSISDDEAGELYRSSYAEQTAELDEIRFGQHENRVRGEVVRDVRKLEREFRQDLCLQILRETGRIRHQPSEPGNRTQKTGTADF